MDYDTIKKNITKGLWTPSMAQIAVNAGIISSEEYDQLIKETSKIRTRREKFRNRKKKEI